jgi:hypothetical protein
MKRLMSLAMVAVVVGLACSSVQATVYNYSTNWDGDGVQGDAGVWYTQWATWDCYTPSNFTDMVWDSTNKCWIKADQSTHKVYIDPLDAENNAIYADPNLKVVIGWQAPSAGTVNFLADGSNWVTQSVYQILDKSGNELDSAYVGSASGGDVSASGISVAAGDRVYFAYRPNSSTTSSIFKHWPIKIEANFTAVPEPMTIGLLVMGGLLGLRRRK